MNSVDIANKILTSDHIGRVGEGVGRPVALDDAFQFWWEWDDGEEGGQIWVDFDRMEVADYDGSFDLPSYIKQDLRNAGIACNWGE